MYKIKNLLNNENVKLVDKKEGMRVIEYQKDLSVTPYSAINSYFSSKMNVRKRQVLIELNNDEYTISAGAMQWVLGNVEMISNVKGVGDLLGKAILMLEPTYRYIMLENMEEWPDGMVLDDGMFLACQSTVNQNVVMRSNVSSALLGKEGLFNLKLD